MKYFYFNPFNKQYLFPKGFKNIELFSGFYQPYTVKGRIIWWFWYNFSLLRNLSQVVQPEQEVPLVQLKKYINDSTVLAFNRGTQGVEKKTSILGFDRKNNQEFFIKYADTEIPQRNVNNEGVILKQLVELEFVPQLQQHINTADFTFIETSVLKGERVLNQKIDKQLLDILFVLSQLKVNTTREYTTDNKTCFAHGDFCPWNMMLNNNKLQIYDWEMAGEYPLGYDLFTYIFQTAFLLTPKKQIEKIIEEQSNLIANFFKLQEDKEWLTYLHDFSRIKLNLETDKKNQRLIPFYQKLKSYAEKV